MKKSILVSSCFILTLMGASCSKDSAPNPVASGSESGTSSQEENISKKVSKIAEQAQKLDEKIKELQKGSQAAKDEFKEANSELESMINSLERKLEANSLAALNKRNLADALNGHTSLYKLQGKYKIIVIPVQFADVKFEKIEFFQEDESGKVPAQDYLFGSGPHSMTSHYSHASLGQLDVSGEVTPVITVSQNLEHYGKALGGGRSDQNARGLVIEALEQLMTLKDPSWWEQYDNWDLSDYDFDRNFHEPDGFVDAVVLVYAGKSQASCQSAFDAKGTRPGTDEVDRSDPRAKSAIECYNRIWPHRSGLYLSANDERYQEKGPVVEGKQRSSLGGLKISDTLFASDYNMQSEFSDLSTFMHEFGHSLSLPDVYSKGSGNSTGAWELMSTNANNFAQEFSTFSKLSLGWINPKVIKEGEESSVYLGAYNFVPQSQREKGLDYLGPLSVDDFVNGTPVEFSIVSEVPEYGEPVYRSVAVLTKPSKESLKATEIPLPESFGEFAAYSGRDDQSLKTMQFKVHVPQEGASILKFDALYHIETETNFLSKDKEIKVTEDYDLGSVKINGELKENLRLVSGDDNQDSLNENLASCKAKEALTIREKLVEGKITEEELAELKKLVGECRVPTIVTKSYDVSEFKGQDIDFVVEYKTDPAYTEFGIIVDNVRVENGEQKSAGVNFESEGSRAALLGDFLSLKKGEYEVTHNQFYLMEYRTPGEKYTIDGKEVSYNMDNNISIGTQSMFLNGEGSPVDRFRMVTYDYQPGVLVWYFNSKYGRTDNNPAGSKGEGYLLVVNSKVKELPLPSVLGDKSLFDENGNYATESETYKKFTKAQRELFACFAYTKYYVYLKGEKLECEDPDSQDYLKMLKMDGKKLVYSREGINEILPVERYDYVTVGSPLFIYAAMRTGLSTFRPDDAGDFAPFKVYKPLLGSMIPDEELTKSAPTFKPVSTFKDSENHFPEFKNLQGDTAFVNKKGFEFKVASPSSRVLELYSKEAPVDSDENFLRRPRAKVYFSWKK